MLLSDNRIQQLNDFSAKIGLEFKDPELLNMAFVHTSYAYDYGIGRLDSYERLEFLGDAVLKLATSEILYNTYEEKTEGELSAQRSIIVADRTIANFARALCMYDLILTGKCGDNKKNETILACAFEALLGAIYIEFKDRGYETAKQFLIDNFLEDILNVDFTNPKAELQELTQRINKNLPDYQILGEKGPDHNKIFTAGVYYEHKLIGKGEAKSKKEAEIEAAKVAIVKLKELYGEI